MQTNKIRYCLAMMIAALGGPSAIAQQVGAQPVGGQAGAAASSQQGPAVNYQQGVVYPGQPYLATQPSSPVAGQPQPGPTTATPPKLPPLPGDAVLSPIDQAVEDTLPKDAPSAIRELRRRLDKFEQEGSRTVRTAPIPKTRSIDITQAPGETPAIIRVAMGVPSSIAFIDASGAPWPIQYLVPGAPAEFDALAPAAGESTLYILPKSQYAHGSVTVKLVDNPTPIPIMVTAAQREVDARVDAHIVHRRGPNAKPTVAGYASAGTPPNPVLSAFLDGVPPQGARVRKASIRGVSAWSFGGQLYVRTEHQLTSPNWYASKFSGETRAYVVPDVSAITVSIDGAMTVVSLDE